MLTYYALTPKVPGLFDGATNGFKIKGDLPGIRWFDSRPLPTALPTDMTLAGVGCETRGIKRRAVCPSLSTIHGHLSIDVSRGL